MMKIMSMLFLWVKKALTLFFGRIILGGGVFVENFIVARCDPPSIPPKGGRKKQVNVTIVFSLFVFVF
jgi:hypothetical protein